MTDVTPRPRVVIATRLYEPEASAAAFRIAAAARALAVRADVTVVTTRAPADAGDARDATAVTVSRARVLRDRSGAIRGYLQYASFDIPLLFRLLVRRADVILAEAPPTTGLVALVAARLRRARFVYYPGDVWTDAVSAMGGSRPLVRFMRWMESRVVSSADLVLAISPEVGERLRGLGAAPDRVVEVGNGIDTDVFSPDVAPHEDAERPYFVYTGTMSEWQRPEIFVEALDALGGAGEGVEVRFFGQGTAAEAVRAAAERLAPGRVHIGGMIPPAEAARWIRGAVAALVSIVPGVGYDFARPTKTYAAAAVGTPVLYAGGVTGAEVVTAGGLGLVAEFTAESVASAMGSLLAERGAGDDDGRRAARAEWTRRHVSLAAVGQRAAAAVLATLAKPRGRSR